MINILHCDIMFLSIIDFFKKNIQIKVKTKDFENDLLKEIRNKAKSFSSH